MSSILEARKFLADINGNVVLTAPTGETLTVNANDLKEAIAEVETIDFHGSIIYSQPNDLLLALCLVGPEEPLQASSTERLDNGSFVFIPVYAPDGRLGWVKQMKRVAPAQEDEPAKKSGRKKSDEKSESETVET